MLWCALALVGAIVIALLFFVLGVAAGTASPSFEYFINSIVPVFSAVGTWVSGVGALGAVLVALWLADKQRREDIENIRVYVRVRVESREVGVERRHISIFATGCGKRSSRVKAVSVASAYANLEVVPTSLSETGAQLPVTIGYSDEVRFDLPPFFEHTVRCYVTEHCGCRTDGLKVYVHTTLNTFTCDFPESLLILNHPLNFQVRRDHS